MATEDSSLQTIRRRIQTAADSSRLTAAVATSRTLTVLATLRAILAAAMAAVQRAVQASTIVQMGTTVGRWARHSFLYRWLTAEPDPEVIVIDLRETYTVGPVLAILDRLTGPLGRSYRQSRLHGLETRIAELSVQAADTRIGQVLGRLLAPPEPPETPGEERAPAGSTADSQETTESETEPPSKTRNR